ncbi:MAG: DUF6713 family protein [Pseudomonadota bacterium]
MSSLFFILGLTFLLLHEMDAVRCREWRILPVTAFLSDRTGFVVFMALHIPLYFFGFLALTGAYGTGVAETTAFWLSIFFIVHLVLHMLLLRHPENEFVSFSSWIWIVGMAIFGGLYLLA